MYCPKCGQTTININGKEICTSCGIVFDDSLPKEQILQQIKSNISLNKADSAPKEEYVSPSAKYLKEMLLEAERKSQSIGTQSIPSKPAEQTVADIAKSSYSGNTATATLAPEVKLSLHSKDTEMTTEGTSPTSDLAQEEEKTISELSKNHITNFTRPDSRVGKNQISGEKVIPQTYQKDLENQKSLSHLPSMKTEDSNRAPIEASYKTSEPVATTSGAGTIKQKEPHHLINDIRPIFIKILFYLLFFTFLAGSGYFIYKNHDKLLEMFNNASIYVGENIFKQ